MSCRVAEGTYTGIRRTENDDLVCLELVSLDGFLTGTLGPSACDANSSADGQPGGSRR